MDLQDFEVKLPPFEIEFYPDHSGHRWARTQPLDGVWCIDCGLAQARWGGDPCGEATDALLRLDAKLAEANAKIAELWETQDWA